MGRRHRFAELRLLGESGSSQVGEFLEGVPIALDVFLEALDVVVAGAVDLVLEGVREVVFDLRVGGVDSPMNSIQQALDHARFDLCQILAGVEGQGCSGFDLLVEARE